jgi:hypothetical protein
MGPVRAVIKPVCRKELALDEQYCLLISRKFHELGRCQGAWSLKVLTCCAGAHAASTFAHSSAPSAITLPSWRLQLISVSDTRSLHATAIDALEKRRGMSPGAQEPRRLKAPAFFLELQTIRVISAIR